MKTAKIIKPGVKSTGSKPDYSKNLRCVQCGRPRPSGTALCVKCTSKLKG